MTLREYLIVIRERWTFVVAGLLLGVVAALALTVLTTRQYTSTAVLYVATTPSTQDNAQALYQGSLLSEQRVKSYTEMIASPRITDPAATQAGLDPTSKPSVSATAQPDTTLITVSTSGPDAAAAARMANAVADEFSRSVAALEQPLDRTRPPAVSIQLFEPAVVATSPTSPKPLVNLPLGAVLGIVLGLVAAFARHTLDTRIRSVQEVERFSEAPNLGAVAFDRTITERPLVVDAGWQSAQAEAFRTIRTNLQFVDVEHQQKVVVVTSALPGEGKSTTSANLALALRAAGTSVCLVEGDLRRPGLADHFGLEREVGLTTVLTGRTSLAHALQPWGGRTMQVLASGVLPPNPSELLGSRSMEKILAELSLRFAVVIVDAPPLLPVTDAAAVGRLCDGALVVVRHAQTTRHQLDGALDALEAASVRLLGTVVNAVPTTGPQAYAQYKSYYGTGAAALSPQSRREFEEAAAEAPLTMPLQTGAPSRRQPAPGPVPTSPPMGMPSPTSGTSAPGGGRGAAAASSTGTSTADNGQGPTGGSSTRSASAVATRAGVKTRSAATTTDDAAKTERPGRGLRRRVRRPARES